MDNKNTLVFVYGTLTNEGVVSAVIGRKENLPKRVNAILNGYRKYGLNILEDEDQYVNGFLLEVSPKDMVSLDRYENIAGGLYQKIDVEVVTDFGTKKAIAYQLCHLSII